MSTTTLAPEVISGVQAAREALEQEAARLSATGDPIGQTVALNAQMAGAAGRLLVDAALACIFRRLQPSIPIHSSR